MTKRLYRPRRLCLPLVLLFRVGLGLGLGLVGLVLLLLHFLLLCLLALREYPKIPALNRLFRR